MESRLCRRRRLRSRVRETLGGSPPVLGKDTCRATQYAYAGASSAGSVVGSHGVLNVSQDANTSLELELFALD